MKMFPFLCVLLVWNLGFSQADKASGTIQNPKFKRSCLKPSASFEIEPQIPEGSGLAAWNGKLWTHNDSEDSRIFALDTTSGTAKEIFKLPVINRDWEEISQDSEYLYVGDFGNNSGRKDSLQIYRIRKQELLNQHMIVDTITFAWPERINPDCEAMVVIDDSIYLFTKEWKTKRRTRVFSLPKKAGKYEAKYKSTLKTRVLITGATFDDSKKRLALCGYNLVLRPFLLVFDDVKNADFFSGSGRKIKIRKRFRQIEGIASFDGNRYYLVGEDFKALLTHSRQALYQLEIPD